MHAILRQIRRAALLSAGAGPSDAQLVESFLSHRDEAAFEALVRRHGPMVLAVCRRVAGNIHDAEDAFQTTFLVLVRKAASLRSRDLLAGWLHGVAYRTALSARAMAKKRRAKEKEAAQEPRIPADNEGPPEELLARLDEALNRLPDRYRLPVVLCELQGHSRKEAAQLLGLPVGTVSWRLAHARKLLAHRLARYGSMLSAGALTAVLSQSIGWAVPARLVRAVTVQAVMNGTIPAPIGALTEGVLKAMLLSKLKIVWGVVLAAVVGAGAVGLMYRPAVAADPNQPGRGGAAARASQDELEELRLEIAALRKGLQATRERVRILEEQGARSRVPSPTFRPDTALPGTSLSPTIRPDRATIRPDRATILDRPTMMADRATILDRATIRPDTLLPGTSPAPTFRPDTALPGRSAAPSRRPSAASAPANSETDTVLGYIQATRRSMGSPPDYHNDPLAAAQAALKRLRKHPNDTKVADRLEQALKQLEALRQRETTPRQ